jgi:hypothetical protein
VRAHPCPHGIFPANPAGKVTADVVGEFIHHRICAARLIPENRIPHPAAAQTFHLRMPAEAPMQDPAPVPPALFSQENIDRLIEILREAAEDAGRALPPDPRIDSRLRQLFGTSYFYLLNEKTRRLRRPPEPRTRKAFEDIRKSTAKILSVLDENPTAKECFSRALLYARPDDPLADFAGKDFVGIMRQIDEFVRLAPENCPPPPRPDPRSMETLKNVVTTLGHFFKEFSGEEPRLNDQGKNGPSKNYEKHERVIDTPWRKFVHYFIGRIRECLPPEIANEITNTVIDRFCAVVRTERKNTSPH